MNDLIKVLISLGIINYLKDDTTKKVECIRPTGTVSLLPDIEAKDFYLEVSARRSGKTTRLINDMLNYIDITGKDVCLITHNKKMYDIILKEIQPYYYRFITNIIDQSKRIYVDEVDLYSDACIFPIQNNAYYVGTPQRNDGRLAKLAALKPDYKKYKTIMDLGEAKDCLSSEVYKREALGEFA